MARQHTLLDDGDVLLCEDHLDETIISMRRDEEKSRGIRESSHLVGVVGSVAGAQSCRDGSKTISKIVR